MTIEPPAGGAALSGSFAAPPVQLGSIMFSLIEPHDERHREYNRWYDRDHVYSGAMCGPGTLASGRYIATRRHKERRYPQPSALTPDVSTGTFLNMYWFHAGLIDDWDAWAYKEVVDGLVPAGRMWPWRTHVLTKYYNFEWAAFRDPDGVPAELALDHGYPGLVSVMVDPAEGVSRAEAVAWMRSFAAGRLVAGSPAAMALCFQMRPFSGERQADLPRDVDSHLHTLWFVEADPLAVWDDVFAPLGAAIDEAGVCVTSWVGGFVPLVRGTDRYLDQI